MNGRGKRGPGLYLVGQWWRYNSGELHPLLNRRIIARRYLASFERERLRTINSAQTPSRWLSNPQTEPLKTDPLLDVNRQSETRGIIEKVSVDNIDSDRVMKIMFKSDAGRKITYVYASDRVEEGEVNMRLLMTMLLEAFTPNDTCPRDLKNG